jgi:DNA-binding SARP family transcriptional activator
MTRYVLTLLGTFEVAADGSSALSLSTTKAAALLAYLSLESLTNKRQVHTRRTLAGLLWPEIGERYALQNLRNTLYALRRTLQQAGNAERPPMLEATRQHVYLNADQVSVDAIEFQTLVTSVSNHAHASLPACPTCLAQLAQAVAFYRGELLAGFSLADAPVFEEWLLLRRELLHQ